MTNDLRLIEDYLPIEGISTESSREKYVRKVHAYTAHPWWSRRPLVAFRARELVRIHYPAEKLDHVKKEVLAAKMFVIPYAAVTQADNIAREA